MRNIIRLSLLVFVVLAVSLANIIPPSENLRLGKDLAGGVSLIYTVDIKPEDPPQVVDRTIEVLKERVNPQGLYEISFVKQGRDRIEVSMPLPSERVKALRAAFESSLDRIGALSIDIDAFQRAMRLRGDERDGALTALMNTPARTALIQPVLDLARKADAAREEYRGAAASGTEQAGLDALLGQAADFETQLDEARDRVIASIVRKEEVRTALTLPSRAQKVIDDSATDKSKKTIELPSPRQRALDEIRTRLASVPDGAATLDEVIARYADFEAKRTGLDDPNDLIRLLQGAGVLTFRIAVAPGELADEARLRQELRERGPTGVQSPTTVWLPINSVDTWYDRASDFRALVENPQAYFAQRYRLVAEERGGQFFVLLKDEPGMRLTSAEGDWALTGAFATVDQLGRPAVAFRMDPRGGALLGALTEANLDRNMAIVLDDEVYSAPNLLSRISTSGQISGNFPQEELQYLIRTLSAGSLSARLSEKPISQSILAPDLGLDNLKRGLGASYIALAAVAAFMVVYYFMSGLISVVALLFNAVFVLGVMSLNQAAFTLPGIAGVVLTFGTAVDANVLIYERIREELLAGNDARTAVRVAFKRAASTIIDANVTNLIVCFVLAFYGTQEIKGFGITLGIGVVGTIFSSLVVTRLIFTVFVDHLRVGGGFLSQLPLVMPWIDRVLTPRIDWMRLFPLFVVVSLALMGLGVGMIVIQGSHMLDNEFRGGTAVTFQFKADPNAPATEGAAQRTTLTRKEVEERVRAIAERAGATGPETPEVLRQLRDAEIVPINPRADGVTSDQFTVRTTIGAADEAPLRAAMVDAFKDVVESRPALRFTGSGAGEVGQGAPVYAIVEPELGRNIGRPEVVNNVASYLGGAVVVLDFEGADLPRKENLELRLEYMRADALFAGTALRRAHELIVLEGTDAAVKSAALVVSDPGISLFESEDRWRASLAQNEWDLVRAALTTPTLLASVNSFSPAVAATFRATAIVSVLLSFLLILIYVWIRFGSVRYSLAALAPLFHDVLIAIGLIAMAEILYERFPGIAAVGIRPFKIDMGMIAAIMAIIGYSINDTLIILDRIRENRGKLVHASKEVVNNSINQTLSRTLITSGTTVVSLLILFFYGGEGVGSFSYAMLCGMLVGTYSSIAVAAPIVYNRRVPPAGPFHTPDAEPDVPGLPAGSVA
ncbi:MAG TPA: protein translocase subunit SecD [Phycisphaerales bacterium]|nr:protein translocase subunit SecD [Phycisphaerales bacterium]